MIKTPKYAGRFNDARMAYGQWNGAARVLDNTCSPRTLLCLKYGKTPVVMGCNTTEEAHILEIRMLSLGFPDSGAAKLYCIQLQGMSAAHREAAHRIIETCMNKSRSCRGHNEEHIIPVI